MFEEVNQWVEQINIHILSNLKSSNKILREILEQNNIVRGKKIRGIFCMTAATYGKFHPQKVLAASAAVEILHCATLIHDDIVDDAVCRRGNQTINAKYGSAIAIFTGDYLFTRSVLLVSGLMSSKHLSIIAKALQGMCEGEVIQFYKRYDYKISKLEYFRIITKKTAVLFMMSGVLGATVSKCNGKILKKFKRFAFNYGIAFQMADDLSDLTSDENKEGKTVLSDLRAGTITLPTIFAMEESEAVRNLLEQVPNNKAGYNNNNWTIIRDEILKTKAIERTNEVIEKYKKRAMDILSQLPKNKNSIILEQMMNYLDKNYSM
jgi:heptaprenyl diphosphate synthase